MPTRADIENVLSKQEKVQREKVKASAKLRGNLAAVVEEIDSLIIEKTGRLRFASFYLI